jgi:hypothetical protein
MDSRAFQMCKEDGMVEPGLDTKMCLMVDAECISSVIDPRTADNKSPPFVKVVDVELCIDGPQDYVGYFKVAITSLILEFYLALHECDHPSELAIEGDRIWEDPLN